MENIKYLFQTAFSRVLLRHFKVLLCFFCLFFLSSYIFKTLAAPPNSPNTNFWVTDTGSVYNISEGGDGTLYISGDFTKMGPATGVGVDMDRTTAVLDNSFPTVTGGTIRAVTSDGSGGWYIGGSFTKVGSESISKLAHINSDGSVDTTINVTFDVSTPVNVLRLNGTTLYVGGQFSDIDGQTRNGIAAIDTTTGNVTSWDPAPTGFVIISGIEVDGSTVYIFGIFDNMGGQTRYQLAAVDSSTALATSWDPSNNNAIVIGIFVDTSTVYIAGEFITMGGASRNNIAAVDKTTGVATSWDPNSDGAVYQVKIDGTTAYVSGTFSTIGGQSRAHIAALSTTTGLATSWDPNPTFTGQLSLLELTASEVYVSGFFSAIGGQTRNKLAAVSKATALATSWNPNVTGNSAPTFDISGSEVYVGGNFSTIGPDVITRNHIAAINPSTGQPTSWDPNADDTVFVTLVDDSTIYAGGRFTSIGGASRGGLAALDATTGLATSFDPGDLDDNATKFLKSGNTLYVGGDFTDVGGTTRNHLAAFDVTDSSLTSWDPNVDDRVFAIEFSDTSTMYVGGNYTSVGGNPRSSLAEVDLSTGNVTSWDPDIGGEIEALLFDGDAGLVYAGGYYSTVGIATRNNIAAIEVSDGTPTSWDPNADSGIQVIRKYNDLLYVGGDFTTIGGQSRNYGATLSISTGLAGSWDPNYNTSLLDDFLIHQNDGSTGSFELYAGGDFQFPNETAQSYFASYSFPDDFNPILTEVTPVTTPTTDTTPDYTFNSTEDGTATYGGSCTSSETAIVEGDNTIAFDALAPGTYSDCTITVTDASLNVSSLLSVTTFTVQASGPGPDTTPPSKPGKPSAPDPTNDNTPRISWGASDDNVGVDHYEIQWCQNDDFSDCSGNTATKTNTSFTFDEHLDSDTWFVRVRAVDAASNVSEWSNTEEFVVDTKDPKVSNIETSSDGTSITVNFDTNEDTTVIIFWGTDDNYSNQREITDEGDTHEITLDGLIPGTEYKIKIIVTDEAGNDSQEYKFDETTDTLTLVTTPPPAGAGTVTPTTPPVTPPAQETPPTTPTTPSESTTSAEISEPSQTVDLGSGSLGESETSLVERVGEILSAIRDKSLEFIESDNVTGTVEKVKEISETPLSQSISLTTALVPSLPVIATGFSWLFSIMPYISFTQLPGLFAGLMRRRRYPWGVAFDSVTKQPLDPVVLTLNDESGKEVAQITSDLYGRYEFLVKPGTYFLKAGKTGYAFPSKKYEGVKGDDVYENIYLGEKVAINEGGKIAFNIPMDPINVDFNEAAKAKQYGVGGVSVFGRILLKTSNILFKVGFIYSTIVALLSISPLNIINLSIFGLYVFVGIYRFFRSRAHSWGVVFDKFNKPVSNAVVRLINVKIPQFKITPVVTDETGRYIYLMDKGTYQVQIQLKDPIQNTYVPKYTSQPIAVDKEYGSIAEDIKLS